MATIVDIKTYQPVNGERIFVDTNVWYWFTYVSSKQMTIINSPLPYQMTDYPSFIERALNNGAELYHCPLTLAELASQIEFAELEYYKANIDKNATKKGFRKVPTERKAVASEIEVAWNTICSVSSLLDTSLTEATTKEALTIFASTTLDTYDCFYTQLMQSNNIDKIFTDDGDFSSLSTSTVYTSNRNMIGKYKTT